MIFAFFLSFLLVSLPGLALWRADILPEKLRAVLVAVVIFMLSLALVGKFMKLLGLSRGEIGARPQFTGSVKKTLFLFISGTAACVAFSAAYLAAIRTALPEEYARVAAAKGSGYMHFLFEWGRSGEISGGIALCFALLLLAIVEELVFRGVIFGSLSKEYSVKEGYFWNAALFGLAHMRPYNMPVSFVTGLIYTYLRVKSGGIAVPVLVHFAYNILLVYFGKYAE